MDAHTIAERLSKTQRRIVLESSSYKDSDTPYRSFRDTARHCDVSAEEVPDACRELRKIGVMEFATGLMTEDGEPYGSGYCLTEGLGLEVRNILLNGEGK